MLTYGELLRRCRKDLNKDMRRTRELIENHKKDLSKTLLKGKNYLKQLGGEMVRPAMFHKNQVDTHHDTMTQYLAMIDYMTENYQEPVPEIDYVAPHIERSFLNRGLVQQNVVDVWVPVGGGTCMFHVPLEVVFDRKSSIIRRTGLVKTAEVSQPQFSPVFVFKLGMLYRLATYFRSVRNVKVVNFLRNLQGKKIFINGDTECSFIAPWIYASKVPSAMKRQKKPDYNVTFDAKTLTSIITVKRSCIYFTDRDRNHLWTAMPGRKIFKHVASLVEETPGIWEKKDG